MLRSITSRTDNQIPYYVYGNRQDGPSFRGPSNSRIYGYGQFVSQISRDQWVSVGGGESGWTIPDPTDPNIIWASGTGAGPIGGSIDRYDERTRQYRGVEVWPDNPGGTPAGDVKIASTGPSPWRCLRTITIAYMPAANSST